MRLTKSLSTICLLAGPMLAAGCGDSGLDSPTRGQLPPPLLHTSTYIVDEEKGGVFITGHDPDYHAVIGYNAPGAIRMIQKAVEYVGVVRVEEEDDLDILLVTDIRNPFGDQSDSRLGIAAAGFEFDVADYGSDSLGTLDLNEVDFAEYDVIIVASDYGGWLRQDELDILNARSDEILEFINGGGGVVALCESGDRTEDSAAVYTGTTEDRYGFLPFVISEVRERQNEVGYTLTDFGKSIGLTEDDINYNYSHVYFSDIGGLLPIDLDADERCMSAATQRPVTDDGAVLEVPLDIKPGSCPNPLNLGAEGDLPVAVLGMTDLPVTEIDIGSLRLLGVSPLRHSLADVATPYLPMTGKSDRMSCNELGEDGLIDLVLHFDRDEVIGAAEDLLGDDLEDRAVLTFTLTGVLLEEFGGNQIQGEDVVWILDD